MSPLIVSLLASYNFSRVPVFDGTRLNIRGLLLVKKLIVLSPGERRPVRSLGLRLPAVVRPEEPLLNMLSEFQSGRAHLALVTPDPAGVRTALSGGAPLPNSVLGIVTLEDVLEQLVSKLNMSAYLFISVVFSGGGRAIPC